MQEKKSSASGSQSVGGIFGGKGVRRGNREQ